ncbi:related to Peroxisomal (S)-2-hydroxy-acid oxidase GLO5 [Cephalotrichum gorgonifer]|uniref:Oxidase FUB9 n=1 Tax=Cephalotrichum gorgonifer TaxID=2041049 RepID=A0AAE8SVJ7_9PEZI|nr:related to Peroxisomal (S)-2-hydroxy-acid oxidase GLO5 [Cephalotrichum gorgonifer]
MASKPELYSVDDFESYAAETLPKMVRDYFNGGALDSITLHANQEAYRRFYIRPRVLRDVSTIDTKTRVFPDGNTIPFPCCVAPAAMQRMVHPDGEVATARACGAYGVVLGLSSFSTTSLEDVKREADRAREQTGRDGEGECVLQMYLFENRSTSEDLIRRAEEMGYKAIVLTVDTPYFGRRLTEIRNRFKVPPHLKMANFPDTLGVKTGSEHRTNDLHGDREGRSAQNPALPNKNDPTLTWDSIRYLKAITKLPIWLKGIMTVEDALLAVQHGADGIFVSNHGGRQLDQAPPTLRVLHDIAKAVDRRVPIHFDGGVRRGSDIFKALCLGASIVWIGRPALWAIAYDGEHGLRNALKILEDEFRACMGLAGCTSLEQLGPEYVMEVDAPAKL